MRVLVACEFSGIVRQAFRHLGHDAWSCDLMPCDLGDEFHLRQDVCDVLADGWDLMIAHPPCTYLCTMGVWWNHRHPSRWQKTEDAMAFVKFLWSAPVRRIAIENPVGYLNSHWQRPTQIIQPWMFGHEANKATCFWLKNLPPLMHHKEDDLFFRKTHVDKGRFYHKANGDRMSVWAHVYSGQKQGEERARVASKTFQGIADAMAEQWGNLLTGQTLCGMPTS